MAVDTLDPVLLTLYRHQETAGDTDHSQIYRQTVRPSLDQTAGHKTNPTFRVFTSASHSVMSLQELIGSA